MRPPPLRLAVLFLLGLVLRATAQSTPPPEQLCGRDILTVGDAWENVQVERYEFARLLESGSLVRWPQRMAALLSHLRFMERRALLPQAERERIALGIQLVAGRSSRANQLALGGDAAGLRAELAQIEAGAALVGQQFPAELLKPLTPLTHLLAPTPPQFRAKLLSSAFVDDGQSRRVTFSLENNRGEPVTEAEMQAAQGAKCHVFLRGPRADDFQHSTASLTKQTGELAATFPAPHADAQQLWIAVTPAQTGREEFAPLDLAPPKPQAAADTADVLFVTRGDLKAELRFDAGVPYAGEISAARIVLTRLTGEAPALEPLAYLIAFSEEPQNAITVRPASTASRPDLRAAPEIDFRFRPNSSGIHRLFAEVRVRGTTVVLPFIFRVQLPR